MRLGLWELIIIFVVIAVFFSMRGRINYINKMEQEKKEELLKRRRKSKRKDSSSNKEKVVKATVISMEDSDD